MVRYAGLTGFAMKRFKGILCDECKSPQVQLLGTDRGNDGYIKVTHRCRCCRTVMENRLKTSDYLASEEYAALELIIGTHYFKEGITCSTTS